MFWVTRSLRRLHSDDEGISFVFVAVLMVALLGMVAFAIDAGALYQERRELQNGSDAAVLAIAEDCARGVAACDTSTAEATAQQYADANAGDDAADIILPIDLNLAAQTIEVITQTETSDGGTIFKPFFAQVIGFGGANVKARSKAAWGVPAGGTVPLAISECEWQRGVVRIKAAGEEAAIIGPPTEWEGWEPEKEGWYPTPPHNAFVLPNGLDNTLYEDYVAAYGPVTSADPAWEAWDPTADPPQPPPPLGTYPGVGMEIIFHTSTPDINDCAAVAGQDADGDDRLPGSFGWLQDAGGCSAESLGGLWYQGEPGNGVPSGCDLDDWLGKIVVLPVFDDFQPPAGAGNIRSYHMVSVMGLLVTGFRFPAGNQANLAGGGPPCSPPDNCLVGYPTEILLTGGPVDPGGEFRGIVVITLLN